MTVQYEGQFMKNLFRWKGSLWKGVSGPLAVWLLCYYLIRFMIIYAIPDDMKGDIKSLTKLFDTFTHRIPMQFLLGFYVIQTVTRWWAQVQAMPWPDDLIANINSMFNEHDDDSRSKRRTIARYAILTFIMGWRSVSTAVQTKYPDNHHLVKCGLLTLEELEILEKSPHPDCHWDYPLNWIYEVVRKKLGNQFGFVKELNTIRANFRTLFNYNNLCVPLVYTQTATVAVYGYFGFCLIGHQYVAGLDELDIGFPFLAVLQFIFSVGWLNVAQDLAKPFGNDDDDIEIVKILERHTRFVFAAIEAPERMPLDSMTKDGHSLDINMLFGKNEKVDTKPNNDKLKVEYTNSLCTSVAL